MRFDDLLGSTCDRDPGRTISGKGRSSRYWDCRVREGLDVAVLTLAQQKAADQRREAAGPGYSNGGGERSTPRADNAGNKPRVSQSVPAWA